MCNGLAEQVNQLQVTLHKMEVAMGAIADAVVFVGEDNEVQWCNPTFESLVNQSQSTILGIGLNHLLPLRQAGQLIPLDSYPDVMIRNGENAATEYEFQRGDFPTGTLRDRTLVLEISGSYAAIAEGAHAVVLVIRDITQVKEDILERQRAEASLQKREELLRTLIDATPDVICFKDGAGRWLESNQANLEFLELQGIDYKGKTDAELAQFSSFYKSALPNCSQTDEQAWLQGYMQRVEEVVPLTDGTATIWDMIKVPLFYPDGRRKGLVILGRDISDRKRTEQALRTSEAQYRDLVQTANSIILRWDTQGNIQFLNEYGQYFFGFNKGEIIGRNVVGTIVSETETSGRDLQALMTEICQHPENYLFNENENICKNGKQVWIAWANKPILDAQGNLVEILSVGTDATERKQAQAALENSLSLLQATFESIQDGILAVDCNGHIVSYNQSFLEMWSVTPEILGEPEHGKRIAYLANQLKDPNEFTKRVKGLYATPEAHSYDLLDLADGRVFERYSCPQRVGDRIVGRVWSFRDITARQRAEAALEASEIKFRNIVENANDILFVLNPEGIFSYLSPNVFNIMGYEPAEMEGDSFLAFIHSDDQPNCVDAVNTVVTTGQGQSGIEYRARYKDGNYYWQVANLAASQDASGNLTIVGIARDITERKQTEEALRQSEARFRALYEATSMAVILTDLTTGQWDSNSAAEKLFGYSRQEFQEKIKHPGDISPPFQPNGQDSYSLGNQGLDLAYKQGTYHNDQWVHRRSDGTDFPAEVWLTVAEVEEGKFITQAIIQDLTERKQVEAALAERAKLAAFRADVGSALAQSDSLPAILNRCAEAVIKHFNAALAGIWMLRPQRDVFQLQASAGIDTRLDTSYSRIPVNQFPISQTPQQNVTNTVFEDLATQAGIVVFASYPLRLEEQLLGMLAVFAKSDLSESMLQALEFAAREIALGIKRKQAEEALQCRAQVESVLSSISRQFIDQDVDTAINFTLQAIAELIGVERSCIYEYSVDQTQFSLIHQWRTTSVEPLPTLAAGGATTTFPWFTKQMFSGQVIQISSLAELPPEAELERELFRSQSTQSLLAVPTLHCGKVVGFLGVDVVRCSKAWSQEDINLLKLVGELIAIGRARHKAEEALKLAKEVAVREATRSVEANRAKSIFLANMSHELRTPLNAILGFAQLMERDAALTSHQRESLAIINRSGEHLLNLINDVLEMSKIESGRIVLNPTAFNLHLLLQTLQEMFQVRTQAKQLSLYFEIAPDLPQYVVTDEGKLSQVLINLLGNAVKFTQVGGVTLRVLVFNDQKQRKTDNEALRILFEVQDTGKGIAPEEMDNLFQPFVQTASGIQTKEGTGLGLTISRQFVQLMGGDIQITSSVDCGSTFSFEVPVTLAEPLAESQQFTKGRVLKLAPNQPVYRVLIVDDRQENRELIWQLLQMVGFETRTATNGQEAIAIWQQWHPHLIWMDMRMPVIDGYEATRRIRAQENGSRTAIIALTASAFEEQQATVLAAGCDDFVRKPFREPVLFEKMAEHLGVHYVYEEKESLPASHFTLHASDLTVMPVEWIAQLNQAALAVDAEEILQLIEQIPETYRAMAEQLADLVHHFCFDEVLALTEESCDA
ncbi:MAG TPA: PAS domain S-box protein [Oculatellaceae cyanobacterium]|jgi:two-component system sensor histidine kinase/response regulator